jgi:hypothetical protein
MGQDSNRYMSVWKQRNAALVRMVPESEEGEGGSEKEVLDPRVWRQDFASSPAEAACLIYRLLPSSQATFSIISQWAQKIEMTGDVGIAETGALTDPAIIEEDP